MRSDLLDNTDLAGETSLVRLCLDLGAAEYGGALSAAERKLLGSIRNTAVTPRITLQKVGEEIRNGRDPLGEAFCRIRSGVNRRAAGAFYTAEALVKPMTQWIADHRIQRIIDPGCGSGRFAIMARRLKPRTEIIAIDIDPVATLMTRANLSVLGARVVSVVNADYVSYRLPRISGRTGYVGNPPYVRHHDIPSAVKALGAELARKLGHEFPRLAGLHAYFFLATAHNAQRGDIGCFVTSAEWLDVGYGSLVRDLMLNGLGGRGVHLFEPRAVPFAEVMTTAAIAYFEAESTTHSMRFSLSTRPTQKLGGSRGRTVDHELLSRASRWTPLLRNTASENGVARPRLGDLVRVSRGQVTGANDFFVLTKKQAREAGISDMCVPAITSAVEILESSGVVRDNRSRKVVLAASADLKRSEHAALHTFLKRGELARGSQKSVAQGYIASHRRPWWAVKVPRPPIIVSYMARQAPRFALNPDGLGIINVAHGLYPRKALSANDLQRLVKALNAVRQQFVGRGRTYHGGLEKFEPGEVEDLPLPSRVRDLLKRA